MRRQCRHLTLQPCLKTCCMECRHGMDIFIAKVWIKIIRFENLFFAACRASRRILPTVRRWYSSLSPYPTQRPATGNGHPSSSPSFPPHRSAPDDTGWNGRGRGSQRHRDAGYKTVRRVAGRLLVGSPGPRLSSSHLVTAALVVFVK